MAIGSAFVCASVLALSSAAAAPAFAAPAAKIGELKAEGLTVSVSGDPAGSAFNVEVSTKGAPIEAPEVFTLDNPPRLVIDLPKVEVKGSKKTELKSDKITGIRVGVHPGKARIVIDLVSPTVPGFVVAPAAAGRPLGVKIDFAASGSPGEPDVKPVDLSDLPKPDEDAELNPAEAAPAKTAKTGPAKVEPIKAEPAITEPEKIEIAKAQPVKPEPKATPIRAPKEPVKKPAKQPEAEAIPAEAEAGTDELPPELGFNPGKTETKEPALKEPAPKEPAAKEAVKTAAGETKKLPDPGKAESAAKEAGPGADTELSDEEALKMLELAGEAVKKPAPETKEAPSGKTLADLAAEPSKHTPPAAEVKPEQAAEDDATPEQLAKLLDEHNAATKAEKSEAVAPGKTESEHPAEGAIANPPPAGSAVVKGIYYRAADDGKTSAVVIEIANLNNYSLSQKKKNLYELTIDQSALAGEHVAYPQFPPDTFQGFEAVLAEQQDGAVVVKLYVAEGTKLSPFRVKDQLWVKVLK